MAFAGAAIGLGGQIAGMMGQRQNASFQAELAQNQAALNASMIRNQGPRIVAESEFVRQGQELSYGNQFRDLNTQIRKGQADAITQFGASGFSGGSQSKLAVLKGQLSQGEYAFTQLTNEASLAEQKRQYALASDLVNTENQARVAQYGGQAQAASIMQQSQTQQMSNYFSLAGSLLKFGNQMGSGGFDFG